MFAKFRFCGLLARIF
jgi:esterase